MSSTSSKHDQDNEPAEADPNTILDRHNKTIASILKRFLNMVSAATEELPKDAIIESANLNRMRMETESNALVSSIPPNNILPLPAAKNSRHPPTNILQLDPDVANRSAQITEIQNLLTINREIKALWIKGPLRKPGEDTEQADSLDRQAEKIQQMYNELMAKQAADEKAAAEAKQAAEEEAAAEAKSTAEE